MGRDKGKLTAKLPEFPEAFGWEKAEEAAKDWERSLKTEGEKRKEDVKLLGNIRRSLETAQKEKERKRTALTSAGNRPELRKANLRQPGQSFQVFPDLWNFPLRRRQRSS